MPEDTPPSQPKPLDPWDPKRSPIVVRRKADGFTSHATFHLGRWVVWCCGHDPLLVTPPEWEVV